MFVLFNLLISIMLFLVDIIMVYIIGIGILSDIYALAVCLPGLAVTVRRLHDTGRSGWKLLLALIPIVGAIIVIVYLFHDSEPGFNRYGDNPKD